MLTSVDAVIEAVGGTSAAAALAGVGPPAVSNWKARGAIPSEYFLSFSEAAGKIDPRVFGFKDRAEVA